MATNAPKKKTVSKKTVPAKAGSLSASVYDAQGKEVRSVELPEALFGAPQNDTLVFQVVTAMEANARVSSAHTKTRGDVRGGGKKPWKQKGTGRARHGSSRSPIWKGGGVTFGPRSDKDYSQKVNKKMRARALAVVLSEKLRNGEVLFVDTLSFETPKTALAKKALTSLGGIKGFEALATRRKNAAFVALGAGDLSAKKSFRNIGSVQIDEARNLNPVDVLSYRFLVIESPDAALEALEKRVNAK